MSEYINHDLFDFIKHLFKYQTKQEFSKRTLIFVIVFVVLFVFIGIIQTAIQDNAEHKQQNKLAAYQEIMYCYDYRHNVVYKCHVDKDGIVVIDQDRDGNNLIVRVIEEHQQEEDP